MTCRACGRANLPGGVRCVYCGQSYPPLPDFQVSAQPEPERPSRAATGWLGALLLLLLKGKSLLTLLKVGPLLTLIASMGAFALAEAQLFPWQLAVGFTLSIFVHELGHVVVCVRHGVRATAPMFIPFLGAVITVKSLPEDPTVESEIAAGGPLAGGLAALLCTLVGTLTGQSFWIALAGLSYVINLFNLLPITPLDGSRIMTAFSPGNYNVVLVVLLLWVLKNPSPSLWFLFVVLLLFRLSWSSEGRHNLATPWTRTKMACIYVLLCLGLSYGLDHSGPALHRAVTPEPATPVNVTAAEAPPPEADASSLLLLVMFGSVVVGVPFSCLLTGYLLCRAAGCRFGARVLALPVAALLGLTALVFGPELPDRYGLILATLLGMAAAFAYAAAQNVHVHELAVRPPFYRLAMRCLGWGLAGGLVVAYARDSEWVVLLVILVGAFLLLLWRWAVPALAAEVAEAWGYTSRARDLRGRALRQGPPPQARDDLWSANLNGWLSLRAGQPVLAALDSGTWQALDPYEPLALRAEALVLTRRYDEALATCEQLLAGTHPERLYRARLVLAQLAAQRGWTDEALSQAGLVTIGKAVRFRRMIGLAYAHKGLFQAGEGEAGAETAARRALQWYQNPFTQARLAVVRQLLRPDEARHHATAALRRLPESLETRYYHALAHQNQERLVALAQQHPTEHYGQLAAEARK